MTIIMQSLKKHAKFKSVNAFAKDLNKYQSLEKLVYYLVL